MANDVNSLACLFCISQSGREPRKLVSVVRLVEDSVEIGCVTVYGVEMN